MRKKIIVPVFITLWAVGLTFMGYLLSIIDVTEGSLLLNEASVSILYKGIIVIMIGTIAIGLILNRILDDFIKPMEALVQEAQLMAKGEYVHRVRYDSMPEMEQLSNAFDAMGENLHRTIRKLEYQKAKAESVLSNLDEGIIVLDEDGIITEMNTFALKLVDIDKAPTCHLNEILREPKCIHMIKEVMIKNTYISCEILRDNKILYIGIMPMQKKGLTLGYVLSIRDMTKTRQLEEMRYHFVNNVTHELKTPLTSIQGFVETLKEGAIDNKAVALRFLDIIDIESKRLYRLIQDILLLSEIESMHDICTDTVDLTISIREVIGLLKEQANKKEIELVFEPLEEIVLENVSEDHMKQVLINLIGNAIKYTDAGNVIVRTSKQGDKQILEVKDTGIGISAEGIERIFERFYRIDKSRSRKSGGTGLGLSIVKHIVNLYHGEIKVSSTEGKGSVFTVIFNQ